MTINTSIEALSRLVTEKPDLVAALQAATDVDEAVEVLAKAGEENGVAVDKAALAAHLAERATATGAKLSDADLDQVAGGISNGMILASIFSAGIACIAVSLSVVAGGGNRDCNKTLENL